MKIFARNALVGNDFKSVLLSTKDGQIESVLFVDSSAGADVIFESGFFIPGLLDIQINGFAGVDFSSATAEEFASAMQQIPLTGTTAVCPTVITMDLIRVKSQIELLHAATLPARSSRHLGIHLEGPFISKERRGAHDLGQIREPKTLGFGEIDLSKITICTLAPELEGAGALIRRMCDAGVTVSIGHSSASYRQANEAFEAGAKLVTHLFNGMNGLHHREPGIPGAVLNHPTARFGVIADGEHVSNPVLALLFKLAAERTIVVSDASAALRASEGASVSLGGSELTVDRAGSARRPDGTLASSGMTQLEAIEQAAASGLDRAALLNSASRIPADLLGFAKLGRLEVGAFADMVHYRLEANAPVVDFVCLGGEYVFKDAV